MIDDGTPEAEFLEVPIPRGTVLGVPAPLGVFLGTSVPGGEIVPVPVVVPVPGEGAFDFSVEENSALYFIFW